MANQNFQALDPTGDFMRHLYSRGAAAFGGWFGECSPLASLTGMVNYETALNGMRTASFAPTPVSVGSLRGQSITMYHDLKDRIAGVVNGTPGEANAQSAKRVSLTMSAGNWKQADGFEIGENYQNAQRAVEDVVNMSNRLGRVAAASTGEFMLGSLCGMRGIEDNYECHADLIDQPGDSYDTMASSPFMQIINDFQGGGAKDEQKVRKLTRNWAAWNLRMAPAALDSAFFSGLSNVATASDALEWKDFLHMKTVIARSGNLGRSDFAFMKARMSGMIENGKRKMTKQDDLIFLTNHEIVNALQQDPEWITAMNSLATAKGDTTGLFTGNAGMLRGGEVIGADKMPIYQPRTGNTARVALSLCLGRGALCVLQGRAEGRREYGNIQNATLRKFMETPFPVKVVNYGKKDTRGEVQLLSVHYDFGVVRPSFLDSNGNREDFGVLALHSGIVEAA